MNVTSYRSPDEGADQVMGKPLRVLTWNIRSLRDDPAAVANVLRQFSPDVVLLQETPRFLRARSKLAALARRSNLVVAEGSGVEVAVLCSLRMVDHGGATTQLSSTQRRHRRWVALSSLSLGDSHVVAAAVHLGLDGEERVRHATEVRGIVDEWAGPDRLLIGADVNEDSSGPAWQTLGAVLTDAADGAGTPTFPAQRPRRRIDALFVPLGWPTTIVSASDIGCDAEVVRASDHRPVVADVMG